MTRVSRTVIDAVRAAVIATTPATDTTTDGDAGAPSAFNEWAGGSIEKCENDRGFVVLADGGSMANYVNVPGRMILDGKITLQVYFLNEGRTLTDSQALIFEDAERLMIRVVRTLHDAGIAGLNEFDATGDFSITQLSESSRSILSIPFNFNIEDDVLTS